MFRSAEVLKNMMKKKPINLTKYMTRAKNTQSSLRTFYDGDSHTKQQMYNAKKFMNKKKAEARTT